jgi:hypothetical protein
MENARTDHQERIELDDSDFVEEEIELFGDPGIATADAKVPKFLLATYLILPIWGIITFYFFWNGSLGWFDRGYWHELQIAANTTFPIENQDMLPKEEKLKEKEPHSQLP